jgi:RNA polymerase sigma-70 factor (ECF subfamily)
MRLDPSDGEILAGCDAEEFAAFYRRHVQAVTSFVGRLFRAPEVVFNVVGETFARALECRHQYVPARAPAVAWLIGIARNLCYEAFERQQVDARARRRLGVPRIALDDAAAEGEQGHQRGRGGAVDQSGRTWAS